MGNNRGRRPKAEPGERRERAEARKGTEEEAKAKRRARERRIRRLAVPSVNSLPPIERPVSTPSYGIGVVMQVTGELVDPAEITEHYPVRSKITSGQRGGSPRSKNSSARGRPNPSRANMSVFVDGGSQ